ncbi:hypothetical protein PCL_10878 [Purpureocillium lilacinum]|uniref:Uncharacterized protein n=1 Tax=Purpureocillium lilacinum TaxID=33203 RepID=A0A2U3ECM0_PURLI|nr:hypothetical protein PCL_10878 [Purpureocillium lilacinum]
MLCLGAVVSAAQPASMFIPPFRILPTYLGKRSAGGAAADINPGVKLELELDPAGWLGQKLERHCDKVSPTRGFAEGTRDLGGGQGIRFVTSTLSQQHSGRAASQRRGLAALSTGPRYPVGTLIRTRTRAFPCPGTYRAWSSASPPTKAIGGSRNPTIRAGRGVSSQVVCGVRVPVAKPAGGGGCQPAASSSWPPRRGFMFSAIEQAPCRFDLSWYDLVREQATRSPPPRSLGFGIQVQHNHRVSSGAGCSSVSCVNRCLAGLPGTSLSSTFQSVIMSPSQITAPPASQPSLRTLFPHGGQPTHGSRLFPPFPSQSHTLFALLGWVACVCDIVLPPPLVVVVVLFSSFPPRGSFLATSPPRRHINPAPLLLLSPLSPNLGCLLTRAAQLKPSDSVCCKHTRSLPYLAPSSIVVLRGYSPKRRSARSISLPLVLSPRSARPRRFGESRTPHFVSPRLPPRFDSGQHSTSTSIAPTTRGLCLPGHASPYTRHALPSALAFPPPPLHITPPFVSPPRALDRRRQQARPLRLGPPPTLSAERIDHTQRHRRRVTKRIRRHEMKIQVLFF